jgi:dTMP kinase
MDTTSVSSEELGEGVLEAGFRRSPFGHQLWPTGARAVDIAGYPGKLVVIEGTDGAGRSTQLALLREWLESRGYGVAHTALTRSRLAGEGLRKAKQGHTLGRTTMDLFYATDFADRLENQVLPALRGGFIVLTDRYIYSAMARSIVRGGDPQWLRDVYRFAPQPHVVFYLKVDLPHLTPRVLARGRFDYWESGMDFQEEIDVYQSFVRYQTRVLAVFDTLASEYGFRVVDGNRGVRPIFLDLKQEILRVVSDMQVSAGKRAF